MNIFEYDVTGVNISKIKVISNHHWRYFKYRDEVPEKVLKDDLDWTNEEDHFGLYFEYGGQWFHVSEFARQTELNGWDAILSLSYFDGIIIKISDDNESLKVGRYYEHCS